MSKSIGRRAFLGSTPIIALAGCLGYKIQRAEVDNRQKQQLTAHKTEVSKLESRVQTAENTVDGLNSQLESLEADKTELQNQSHQLRSDLSTVEADLEAAKIDHVVSIYSAADEARKYGNGAWSNGIEAWNDENYASSTGYFGRSYGDYGRSSDLLELAENQASEYGLTDGGSIGEAITYLKGLHDAAFDMENASFYAAIDDTSSASNYQDKADAHLGDISDYEMVDVSELETRLG